MNRLIGGLYRYTDGQFSILSFQPQVIESALPHLESTKVEDSAQIRAKIGNLKGSHLEGWANNQLYQRAKVASVAGANFLDLLTRQLAVDAEDAAESARQILGAELQCPLGGDYEFDSSDAGWTSSAWNGNLPDPSAPQDYVAPVMSWFRGASASLTQFEDRVVADLTIDIERK